MKENNQGKEILKLLQDNYDIKTVQYLYGIEVSATMVSNITDKIIPEIKERLLKNCKK